MEVDAGLHYASIDGGAKEIAWAQLRLPSWVDILNDGAIR